MINLENYLMPIEAALYDFGMVAQNALQSLRYEDKDIHTGLYNRRGFLSVADYMLLASSREKLQATLIYFDVLNIANLMEEYGSLIEREILIDFVEVLKSSFRSSDVIARIGESRFVVLTSHRESFNVESLLLQLKEKVALKNCNKNENFQTSYTVGTIDFAPEYFKSSGRLIDLVDKRMMESQYSELCSLQRNIE